jgi:hypothetical protein
MAEKCLLAEGVKPKTEIIMTIIIYISLLFLLSCNITTTNNNNNNNNNNSSKSNNDDIGNCPPLRLQKEHAEQLLTHLTCTCSLALSLLCTTSRLSNLLHSGVT